MTTIFIGSFPHPQSLSRWEREDKPICILDRLHFRKLHGAILAGLFLAGCASSPATSRIDAETKYHANSGYIAAQVARTSTVSETWTIGADQVDVTLMMPSGKDVYPLVIYLPGLGESPDSGLAWRRAWAEAGYAVLSIQPATMGKALAPSLRPRNGEASNAAREYYSPASLNARLATLQGVLEELKQRRLRAGPETYRHVDLSRVAIAGFDLGALTAMVVAGEQIDGVNTIHFPEEVRCVIALSPYADFSGMAVESLFRSIRLPVLSITSTGDTDQYGLVTSPAVRRAPYQYMPPGEKYLLVLSAAPHALIAGNEKPPEDGKEREAKKDSNSMSKSGGSGGHTGRSGGRGGGKRRGGEAGSDHSSEMHGQRSQANWTELLTDAQSVTTAYLDAMLKNDAMARDWLAKDAQRWLGDSADLLSK